tara:strand:- start:27189 stop:27410 length:222 start_codon:yes stop_codon:yes gene_type:complete
MSQLNEPTLRAMLSRARRNGVAWTVTIIATGERRTIKGEEAAMKWAKSQVQEDSIVMMRGATGRWLVNPNVSK